MVLGGLRGTSWVTLPGGTPPPVGNLDHDAFGQPICAPLARQRGGLGAGEGRLRRYAQRRQRCRGPGTWTTVQTILERTVKPKKDETQANGLIRDAAAWTELAVNLEPPPAAPAAVGAASRGAVCLGTLGKPGKAEVDTLWWFDGNERWFATGLRAAGVNAPVTAIAFRSGVPRTRCGWAPPSACGRATRNLANPDAPSWTWTALLNGCPKRRCRISRFSATPACAACRDRGAASGSCA